MGGRRRGRKSPLVTVILPAYNAEPYIAEAIRSVLAQTYRNWELLILDDCSTDRTAEIAEEFEKADPRIRLIRNLQNEGAAGTRNRGLDLARGEWVALLDSDDRWHRDKLEKQLAMARKTDADILYCSYAMIDGNGAHRSDFLVPGTTSYETMLRVCVLSCTTVLLSGRIVATHRFPLNCYHEDYAFWLMLLREGYRAVACRDVLADYRVLRESRSGNKLKAAGNRWKIYRETEKLPLLKSVGCFCAYMYYGLVKYSRAGKKVRSGAFHKARKR